jgi:ubiquinone/menaquinone biosynthesis C-methylase UbiE
MRCNCILGCYYVLIWFCIYNMDFSYLYTGFVAVVKENITLVLGNKGFLEGLSLKNKKDFDKVYNYYDKFMTRFNLYKLEEIKKAADLSKDEIVLDIGGGTGQLAQYISDSCNTVYVLDESEKMLSKVNKSRNLITIQENALKVPFENNSIDTVIISDVFHHIREQEELLKEVKRVLKDKGHLVMLDFEKRHIKTRILRAFEFMLFGRLFFKSKDEASAMLEKHFKINKLYDKGYYFIVVGEKIC